MTPALVFMALFGWGYWLMVRGVRDTRATKPVAAAARGAAGVPTVLGLEDDPDQWRAIRGAWSALDECQLIRLLTDSAPVIRPATTPIDNAIPQAEQKDTP